ncbi:restriction endonuclease [Candidatus Margulisiibacteriota bacterium]
MRTTASDLVHAIGLLPRDVAYNYVNPRNREKISIVDVVYPEGPIKIKRYNPSSGEGIDDGDESTISAQMLWRVANAISPGHPINIDRIVGASYNTRSVLEALLANTPEYYFCYPGRIEILNSSTEIKTGHKHLMWLPNNPHQLGIIKEIKTDMVISEVPSTDAIYESITLPTITESLEIDIEIKRRHAQIQIALIMIGMQLGSRVWIAQNDKSIIYKGGKIGEMKGVISSLSQEKIMMPFSEAVRAATLIDCIWFRNSRFMPAVFEIEHSTGVVSGLSRMKNLQDTLPAFEATRWVVVAPDEIRDKVIREANKEQFHPLKTKFFPYSGVEELYSLCQRRRITGVNDGFLDSFMENCLNN